jgi:hypothetical protein
MNLHKNDGFVQDNTIWPMSESGYAPPNTIHAQGWATASLDKLV